MAAAAATAVGVLGAAYLSKRGSDNAAKRQMQSTDKALSYQREQDAYERSVFERDRAEKQKRYDDWLARRPGGAGGGGAANPTASYARAQPPTGTALADLISANGGGGPVPAAASAPTGGTSLAELAKWSDHNQYFQA